MDSDSDKRQKKKNSNCLSFFRNVLQSIWIRCYSVQTNTIDGKLLAFNFGFLPAVGIVFYIILLVL